MTTNEESNLVKHAELELDLIHCDPRMKDCLVSAIREFAKYGHSGGSAIWAISVLNDLLQFKNIAPIFDTPFHWNYVGDQVWQSTRNPEVFSVDKGKTHYYLSEGGNQNHPYPSHLSESWENWRKETPDE